MTRKEELIEFLNDNIDDAVTKSLSVVQVVLHVDRATNSIMDVGDIVQNTFLVPNTTVIAILRDNFSDDLQGHYPGSGSLLRINSWETSTQTRVVPTAE